MAIPLIPAMTGFEIRNCAVMPPKIAWMACHFSPVSPVLSDLPSPQAKGSLLILNDRFPIADHDPHLIATQLSSQTWTSGILLDFQRAPVPAALDFVRTLVQGLPCPVAVPPEYAEGLDCPVFLPPIPPHIPPEEYVAPWRNRQIWLEVALDASEITVTAQGSSVQRHPYALPAENDHQDEPLFCHYRITQDDEALRFYLYRTIADTEALLNAGNITLAVGLYQEFGAGIKV